MPNIMGTIDPNILLILLSLLATCGGFVYTWVRESRTRKWQLQDAKVLAEKVTQDAAALAIKISNDSIALATKVNTESIAIAAKAASVVEDAAKLADKVHASSEVLVGKVTENTVVSSIAAQEAKNAYSEANAVNHKIADLNSQLLVLSDHIRNSEMEREKLDRAVRDEVLFNERVNAAISDKLSSLDIERRKRGNRVSKS